MAGKEESNGVQLLAGRIRLIAGLAMSAVARGMKPVGLEMDPHQMWATMLKAHGAAGYLLGFIVHLLLSAAVGLIYAVGFDLVGAEASLWAWGLLGGAIHWLIAGVVMGVIPAVLPEISERRRAPGLFLKNFGMPDVPAFLADHLAYGLAFGIVYEWLT